MTNLALLAGGTLTLPATLEVAGDLRVEGANITSGGIINLEADRLLFVSGSAADLNTTVNQLDVNSGGNLTVANTGDLQLIDLNCDFIAAQAMGLASDLTINVTGDLTVVDDVIAGDLGDNNSTGSVLLTSTGNTNVRDVVLADNGDITIQAAQDLTISTPDQPAVPDAVTSTGIVTTVTGDISLDAGGAITMEDDGTVDAQVIAGRVIEEPDGAGGVMPLFHDPEVPDIRLGGGADAGDPAGGTITLSAEDNITISTLQTSNNTIDAVRITSVSGEVIDSGDTSSDILANEDGAIATISAATGIGNTRDLTLPAPPVDAALDVQLDIVDATNSMAGDIAITEEATSVSNDNPDIDILNLNNGADTGDIVVVAQNGTITVADEVDTVAPDGSALVLAGLGIEAQAGTVRLDAQDVATPPVPGSDSSVEINNRILTQGGVVDIDAADDVNFSAAGDVSTNGGDVTVSADPDNDGNGAITMTDGAVVDAGAGTITFEADQDITLGSLITTTDVNITTRGGGVVDGGDENTATAGVADIVADTATIVAKQGVGDADALELEVNNIDVDNSNEILTDPVSQATGDINLIQEADGGDINVLNLVNDAMTATGGGNISLTAEDGTITVAAAGQGIAAQDGTVTLDAQDDDADPAVGSASGVEINNTITTQGGDVNILAEDDVNFAAAGDVLTNGGDVTVSADPDNDGNGAIVMTDGAVVDSGTGTITFSADEDITLSSLVTTNATATAVTITTDGSVIDGDIVDDDTVADISAANGRVVIRAGGDVGVLDGTVDFFKADADDINPIETFTAELDVVAGGVIAINELNPLSVIINAEASTAFFTSAGDLTFSDATPTVTNLALLVDGTLTLPTTLEVAGDLRIEGGDVDVATPDGIINLTANRLLFISESTALENLVTNVDQLDVTSAGNLTVNNSGDLELIDLNCDFIAAQTLGLASDLTISVAGDLLVVDDVIAGAEDDNVSTGSIMLTSAGNTEIHDVVLADNGDISIQAGQDLTLSTSDTSSPTLPAVPPITSTGIVTTVGGNISLEAGDAITMEDDGTVDTQIIAGRDITVFHDPTQAVADISLGGGADAGDPVGGTITLSADENVTISTLQTTNNTAEAVQITSGEGVIDGGDTSTDIVANEVGAIVSIDAVTGVGDGNALDIEVANIDVDNVGPGVSGNIELTELSDGGDINVLHLDNDAAAGNVTLTAINGTVTVVAAEGTPGVVDALGMPVPGAGVEAMDGTVTLDAQGAGSDVIVNNTITTVAGDVDIDAVDDVVFSAAGDVTTEGGNVTVTADVGAITMDNDTLINADSDAVGGTISLQANEDITLGGLRTNNNTAAAVSISTNAAVVDGGNAFTDIVANEAGAIVTIDAVNGVGSGNALEIEVANIDVDNVGPGVSGNIELTELSAGGDINVLHLDNDAAATVILR